MRIYTLRNVLIMKARRDWSNSDALSQAQIVVDALDMRPKPPVKNKPDMGVQAIQMLSHFRIVVAEDAGAFFALPAAAVPSLRGARTTRMAVTTSTQPGSCLPLQSEQSAAASVGSLTIYMVYLLLLLGIGCWLLELGTLCYDRWNCWLLVGPVGCWRLMA